MSWYKMPPIQTSDASVANIRGVSGSRYERNNGLEVIASFNRTKESCWSLPQRNLCLFDQVKFVTDRMGASICEKFLINFLYQPIAPINAFGEWLDTGATHDVSEIVDR